LYCINSNFTEYERKPGLCDEDTIAHKCEGF